MFDFHLSLLGLQKKKRWIRIGVRAGSDMIVSSQNEGRKVENELELLVSRA